MRFSHILLPDGSSAIVTRKRPPTIHDSRYAELIELLIAERVNASISQTTLADKLGIEQPDVSKVERLVRRIDVLEFFDWVNALAQLSNDDPRRILSALHNSSHRPSRG